jgi:hypothetical protein
MRGFRNKQVYVVQTWRQVKEDNITQNVVLLKRKTPLKIPICDGWTQVITDMKSRNTIWTMLRE